MPVTSKPWKYFWLGVKIDVLIVGVLCLLLLVYTVWSYDGRCPDFFSANTKECSFPDYLKLVFALAGIFIVYFFWWVAIPGLLAPPLVGLMFGYYKSGKIDRPKDQEADPH